MNLDFVGDTIDIIHVASGIRFYTASGWQIDLPGPISVEPSVDPAGAFVYEYEDSGDNEFSETPPTEFEPLLGQRVVSASVDDDGSLRLATTDYQLSNPADADYESWELHGPRGQIVICGPGGDLSIWGPREADADHESN